MPSDLELERRRILEAYARRERAGLDGGYFGLESEAHALRLEERYRATRRLLVRAGFRDLARLAILDVGCGDGAMLLELVQWGADPERLAGIDLRPEIVERARRRLPAADLRAGCGSELSWPPGSFDLVMQQTAMSSILDPGLRKQVAEAMTDALAPQGAVLWYDTFRANPHNPDVYEIREAELGELFPGFEIHRKTITFLPHVARRLPPRLLELVYPLLASIPGLRSHHLVLLERRRR